MKITSTISQTPDLTTVVQVTAWELQSTAWEDDPSSITYLIREGTEGESVKTNITQGLDPQMGCSITKGFLATI